MTKAVFRPGEVAINQEKVYLDPPTSFPELSHLLNSEEEQEEITEEVEEYTGPTADDLRREAEQWKAQWESEKEAMIDSAKAEAERIIKDAESAASSEMERSGDEAESIKQMARDEAVKIIAEAGEKAKQDEAEARAIFEAELKEAKEQACSEGREAGFEEGKAEVERLIQRTQIVLQRAQDKRGEILEDTEQEIINLVLLISRKVVKVISENQKSVIISNVAQALKKVKTKGTIIIRVNLADLQLATEHTKNFISRVESGATIQIAEDPSVDAGGCIIETDFGEIDARIASQLAELEAKILEISPIRSRAKPASTALQTGFNGNGN